MTIKKIKIGNTDLETYPFVLGGNVFGWTADEKTSSYILDEYVDRGFSAIDTADMYSAWVPGNKGGESETIIGNWMHSRKNRDKIFLATKVGAELDATHKGLKKEYIFAEIEQSLKRLRTDYIDVYYTHYDDLSIPIEDVLVTYALLIQQGKVRYIGASNLSGHRLDESMRVAKLHDLPAYAMLQPEYNLYDRQSYEKEYKAVVEKYGLAVFTYYSLASGFLTGKYHSLSDIEGTKRFDKLKDYFDERGMKILHTLQSIAQSKGVTPAQLALAWLIHQPTVTAPIASVSKPDQLDILKAVEIDLSDDELKVLNENGCESNG